MNGSKQNNIPINLLLLNKSVNDAESCISSLRNAKLAVHPQVVTNQAELLDQLNSMQADLILLTAETGAFDLDSTVSACVKKLPDVPLILINRKLPEGELLKFMHQGARDIVNHEDEERLQLVVKREVDNLLIRMELSKARKMLSEAEDRCTGLIESSRDAIAYIHEGMHMYANPVYLEMFGYVDMDELEGLPILDMISKQSLSDFKSFLKQLGDESTELELTCQNSEGEPFAAKLEFSPAAYDDEPCTQIIIRSTGNSKELEHTIEQLSSKDSQTGLPNRQSFMQQLEERLAQIRGTDQGCSLLYVTVDDFQKLRAESIVTSDTVFIEAADLLAELLPDEGTLFRFGDHTFTILSDLSEAKSVEALADSLRQSIEQHAFEKSGSQIHLTISIGVSLLDAGTDNSQEFINHSYQACEEARSSGGNQVSLFDAGEMSPSYGENDHGDETRINQLIDHAIKNDRFRLAFQPIVSLQGDSRENYAVLTRLLDHNDDEIQPEHFIKYAKQGKQMCEVDRWVIKHAIKELTAQRKDDRKVNFFVSLSAESLEDDGLLLYICDCLRDAQAKGAWLTFQISDTDIRKHLQASKKLIEGLKKIKCQLAIDQYGTHDKNESLLKGLPIDFVKFDFELMDDLATKQDKQDRLNELNSEAISHNIKTVAMGVEDANSLAVLWTVGVNYIQGYFLQEPSESIAYEFGSA